MSAIRLLENKSGIRSADDYTPLVRIFADASCLRNGAFHESAGCGAVMIDHNRLEIKLVAKYLGQLPISRLKYSRVQRLWNNCTAPAGSRSYQIQDM